MISKLFLLHLDRILSSVSRVMSGLTASNFLSLLPTVRPKLHRISESAEFLMKTDNEESNNNVASDPETKLLEVENKDLSLPFNNNVEVKVEKREHQLWVRISAAAFYMTTSTIITMINKVVLTTYKFPSYQIVALGQIGTVIIVLFIFRELDLIDFPLLDKGTFRKIFPLPLLFIGNAYSGLGGTKAVSLPILTALRKFSLLFTLFAERILLGTRPPIQVQIAVMIMILGAMIASSMDLTFSLYGYAMVTLNNLFTAANGVYVKKKLDTTNFGKYGLLYYNSLVVIFPGLIIAFMTGDIEKTVQFPQWNNVNFVIAFLASCFLGLVLNFSMVLCTHVNSALTTMVVGCLKDVMITYGGMFVGGDYIFAWVNFLGLNVCTIGTIFYTYVVFLSKKSSVTDSRSDKSKPTV